MEKENCRIVALKKWRDPEYSEYRNIALKTLANNRRLNCFRNKHHTEENKNRIRKGVIRYLTSRGVKFKDTSIELKIRAELVKNEIKFIPQYPLCDVCISDFYLPKLNAVIFCDGTYWHSSQQAKRRDSYQTKVLTDNGYNVFRFTQKEIETNSESCIKQIIAEWSSG